MPRILISDHGGFYGHDDYVYAQGLRDFNSEFATGVLNERDIIAKVRKTVEQNLPYKPKWSQIIKLPQGFEFIIRGGQHKVLAKLIQQVTVSGGKERLIHEVSRTIVNAYRVPSKDFVNEAGAIQNFLQRQIRYTYDMGEQFQLPHRQILDWYHNKSGSDCDCLAMLYASLMLSLGWRSVWVILVDSRGDGVLSHACVAIIMPKDETQFGTRLVNVELTRDVPLGWYPQTETGKVLYTKYFRINVVE